VYNCLFLAGLSGQCNRYSSSAVDGEHSNFKNKAYITQLASVRQEAMEEASAKLVVIGCGKWNAIQSYAGNL